MVSYKASDGTFEFIHGKSYVMKYRRTTMFFVYEKECDWLRVEHSTSKDTGYAFINCHEIVGRYSYYNNSLHGDGKRTCRELTDAEIKERNAMYNTWEQIEKSKPKFYKK